MLSGLKRISWMRDCLGRFLSRTHGNLTMVAALSAPVLMAAGGLATDYATFAMKVSNLQSVADTAALAGAKELGLASSQDTTVIAATKSYVKSSLSVDDAATVATVTIDHVKGSVHVLLSEAWAPTFGSFINAGMTPVKVSATATLAGAKNLCVMALSPDSNKAVELSNSSKITANGCSVYSDSSDVAGLSVSAQSSITADVTCSVGGIKASGMISPAGITDCAVVPDPLADRSPPPVGNCSILNKVIASGNLVLLPGRYCGGLKIAGTASVTFSPGIYVISGGPFEVTGNASITGNHVGFHLIGDDAQIKFTQNSTISLNGPADGPMAGLLFFEDRSQEADQAHIIDSSTVKNLTGTIYLPRGYLSVHPSGNILASSAYTAVVANRIELGASGNLVLNSNYGGTDVPVPASIKSSLTVVLTQ
jgi:Flp pilus assembly protein TadG